MAALRAQSESIRALGATALYMFGSTARDQATASSDLDLFLDYDDARRFSLIELAGIQHLLRERLGVAVDVTTRDSLDPLLRGKIEATAVRVF